MDIVDKVDENCRQIIGKDPFERAMIIIFVSICMLILIAATVFEGWILYQSYAHADEIECAWYGCTYTTTVRSTEAATTTTYITSTRTCFENGVQVNCSALGYQP